MNANWNLDPKEKETLKQVKEKLGKTEEELIEDLLGPPAEIVFNVKTNEENVK